MQVAEVGYIIDFLQLLSLRIYQYILHIKIAQMSIKTLLYFQEKKTSDKT